MAETPTKFEPEKERQPVLSNVEALGQSLLGVKFNSQGEDVCGIRQSMSEGMNILDITKERGFAATLIELCDNSANNSGTSQQGHYELQGKQYGIYITSLMGKDGFAKGFYISFVLDA